MAGVFGICSDAHAHPESTTDVANSSDANAPVDTVRCLRHDGLQPRGTESPPISTCETLSPEWGGLRDKLADDGWLIGGGTTFGGTYDLFNHREHPQLYIGQDPSYRAISAVYITYDLSRIGFPGTSQLVINANVQAFSYAQENPSGLSFDSLYINQRFNDGQVQLQYGYDELETQFYGFSLGTNTTSSPAGVGSSIPFEVGFLFNKTAPEANLRLASHDGHFYERAGVTRSVSPQGVQADWDSNNFWGMKWHIPGARALYIHELGYQIDATPQQNMTWLRQGVIYNESRYVDFRTGSYTSGNYAYYLVGDHQLMQTDATQPFRGIYINAKADYAPPDRNIYSSDIGITPYLLGPLGRSYDVVSLSYTFSRLSKSFQLMQQAHGFSAVDYSSTYSLSYVYRVTRGIYFSNQLSYTVNPIPTPKRPSALTWTSSLSFSY